MQLAHAVRVPRRGIGLVMQGAALRRERLALTALPVRAHGRLVFHVTTLGRLATALTRRSWCRRNVLVLRARANAV